MINQFTDQDDYAQKETNHDSLLSALWSAELDKFYLVRSTEYFGSCFPTFASGPSRSMHSVLSTEYIHTLYDTPLSVQTIFQPRPKPITRKIHTKPPITPYPIPTTRLHLSKTKTNCIAYAECFPRGIHPENFDQQKRMRHIPNARNVTNTRAKGPSPLLLPEDAQKAGRSLGR